MPETTSLDQQLDVGLLKLLDLSAAIVGTVEMLHQGIPLPSDKRVLLIKHLRSLNLELIRTRAAVVSAMLRYQAGPTS